MPKKLREKKRPKICCRSEKCKNFIASQTILCINGATPTIQLPPGGHVRLRSNPPIQGGTRPTGLETSFIPASDTGSCFLPVAMGGCSG